MYKIGLTTTVPAEVLLAARYTPIDLNNIFITSKDYLKYIDKAVTWKLAHELGVLNIVKETLTCYNGIKGNSCGDCPACELRKLVI